MSRDNDEQLKIDLDAIRKNGSGTIFEDKQVEAIILRRYNSKADDSKEKELNVKRPKYTIVTSGGSAKAFSYSSIEAAQGLADDVENNYGSRILLICSSRNVGEKLWYTAKSIVNHHNGLIDMLDPVRSSNPFKQNPGGRINVSIILEQFSL